MNPLSIYFFGGTMDEIDDLAYYGFDGTLFLYNAAAGDQFIKIATKAKLNLKFNYMVAMRPYAISPHYLALIHNTLSSYISHDSRLQLNLISGNPRPEELQFDGYVDDISDYSSKIDKAKYLIKYLDVINNMKVPIPDIYVSITNKFVFDAANKHKNKTIIQYTDYINQNFDTAGKEFMLSIGPILREEGEELPDLGDSPPKDRLIITSAGFAKMLNHFRKNGIREFIFFRFLEGEKERICKFVKDYKAGKYEEE